MLLYAIYFNTKTFVTYFNDIDNQIIIIIIGLCPNYKKLRLSVHLRKQKYLVYEM